MSDTISECDKTPKTVFQQVVWDAVKTQDSFDTPVHVSSDRVVTMSGRNFPDSFELLVAADWKRQMSGPLRIAKILSTGVEYVDSTFDFLQGNPKSVRETAKFFAELIEICEMIAKCKILAKRPKFIFQSLSNVARDPKTAFQKALLSAHENQIKEGEARRPSPSAFDKISYWLVGLANGTVVKVNLVFTDYHSPSQTRIEVGLQTQEGSHATLVSIEPGKIVYVAKEINDFLKTAGGFANAACLLVEIMEIVPLMAKIGPNAREQK